MATTHCISIQQIYDIEHLDIYGTQVCVVSLSSPPTTSGRPRPSITTTTNNDNVAPAVTGTTNQVFLSLDDEASNSMSLSVSSPSNASKSFPLGELLNSISVVGEEVGSTVMTDGDAEGDGEGAFDTEGDMDGATEIVGDNDGASDTDGATDVVGAKVVGCEVGALEMVGEVDGASVGTVVGRKVGVPVGNIVGLVVGVFVGASVGNEVGTSVGNSVGLEVGPEVVVVGGLVSTSSRAKVGNPVGSDVTTIATGEEVKGIGAGLVVGAGGAVGGDVLDLLLSSLSSFCRFRTVPRT